MNDIKSIREYSGLTQKDFAEKYSIPLRTLEGWSSGRRNPPDYVLNLLKKVVEQDFPKE